MSSSFLQQTRDVSTRAMQVVSFSDDFSDAQSIRIPNRVTAGNIVINDFDAPVSEMTWFDIPTSAIHSGVEIRAH